MFPTITWQQQDALMLTLGSAHGPEQQRQEDAGLAEQLLLLCTALSLCRCEAHMNTCFQLIMGLASLRDGPLQRLARIMVHGLVQRRRRLMDPSSSYVVDRDLSSSSSIRAARYSFIRLLPCLKVAYVAINRAILDAMENEKFVHIIDLSGSAAHPWQWLKLMRAFHRRPQGAPDLRVTVVHDDRVFLADTFALLRERAESLNMAFSFHGVLGRLEALDYGNLHAALEMKCGYARAFSCALQMHRLLAVEDDATTSSNAGLVQPQVMRHHHRHSPMTPLSPFAPTTPSPSCLVPPPLLTRFQHAVRAAAPKILAVVEQEASHNSPDLTVRFEEALHYYAALFDALHDRAGREDCHCQVQAERAQVERFLLGEEIKDLLVRDGTERHERHELFHQWAQRMLNAGFGPVQLSYVARMEADEELRKCRLKGYENTQSRGHMNCLLLCRDERPLYAVSAWRPWPLEASASVVSVNGQHQHQISSSAWTWPQEQAARVHINFTS